MDFIDSLFELSSEGSFGAAELLMAVVVCAIPVVIYFVWRQSARR